MYDPLGALRVLLEHGVHFVVIGGFAGRLWGSPTVTNDIDLCYERSPANLERLATALVKLGARLRGAPDDVRFLLDARTLAAGMNFTFTTDHGPVDVLGQPSGGLAYDELAEHARTLDLGGQIVVLVCDLDDLIHMKRAAGRRKDLIEVEVLEAVRIEIEEGES